MLPRSFLVELTYNKVQATEEISPYLNAFTYTDTIDESDTISLTLIDREEKWVAGWMPQKEDTLTPSIILKNWSYEGEIRTILCGDFIVDDFSFSGPPVMLTIGGISSPINTDFKETKRSQTWKKVSLNQIGTEIAGRYSLQFIFDGTDIQIEKIEQSSQTDAEFLKKIAEKYGFGMKVYSGKLILFDYATYEKKEARTIIKKTDIQKWSYKSSTLGTYTGARVSYVNPKTKKKVEVTVGKEGRLYKTSEKADSLADAERIGMNAVRNANRKETTISLTMSPVLYFCASDNIQLEGFGKIDGKYQVEKITHQISTKDYSIQINAWKVADEQSSGKEETEGTGNGNYIVKQGDTLWDLAKTFYGDSTKYSDIYIANKEKIEEEAKKRGKASSSNGYWIFPGTELVIP